MKYNVNSTLIFTILIFSFVVFSCKKSGDVALKSFDSENDSMHSNLLIIERERFDYFPTSTTNQIVYHDNFTLSYNEKYEQAEWVAYELRESDLNYSNDYKRPFFKEDPKVVSYSADWRNYKNSGYDKGHLCPAADRKFSKRAYEETFYTSNIAPQKHKFNNGVWNRLEEKVRYWASKYDDIYVITGGVFSVNMKTIGREKVAVPNYFYKVLMDNSNGKYKMIAFLVPHEESNAPLYKFAISVDKLEKMTGLDFFPKLNDLVENTLEKNENYKSWSF